MDTNAHNKLAKAFSFPRPQTSIRQNVFCVFVTFVRFPKHDFLRFLKWCIKKS